MQAWRFKWAPDRKRHVGPTAEDFHGRIGLGDGKTIATVDVDGALMAAVQELYQKIEAALAAKNARIAKLEDELAQVRAAIADR